MSAMKGKTALITGASSGIGRACAARLAAEGASLVLAARRLERLESLQEELAARNAAVRVRKLDVRDRADVFSFAGELREAAISPDILINNAGLSSGLDPLHKGDFADWDRMIETNVTGLLNVSRAIIPMMVEKNAGHIVNIGSIAGRQVYPGGNVYNATKFAVRALTEGMSIDLLGTSVRVSCVSPGAVETEFSEVRFHGDRERAKKVYQGFKPLAAEDIADAVSYVLNTPAHVNILEMIILPTAQRNVYCWHREEGKG